ncbi:MAG: MAPEG family protein [Pseudomonadota bacterium]
MELPVTTFSTIALGALYIVLTIRVFSGRRSTGVSLGDGDDKTLTRRIRGQGNFVENVPITILLILVAEMQTVSLLPGLFFALLVITAAAFVMGRLLHGYAFAFTDNWPFGRVVGMSLSFFSTIALVPLALFAALT